MRACVCVCVCVVLKRIDTSYYPSSPAGPLVFFRTISSEKDYQGREITEQSFSGPPPPHIVQPYMQADTYKQHLMQYFYLSFFFYMRNETGAGKELLTSVWTVHI